jgi:hypothetical protein
MFGCEQALVLSSGGQGLTLDFYDMNILVIAPHPDDEIIGRGGALAGKCAYAEVFQTVDLKAS